MQGVPKYGLIDTGADISSIGGILFENVATLNKLKKFNLILRNQTRWPKHMTSSNHQGVCHLQLEEKLPESLKKCKQME